MSVIILENIVKSYRDGENSKNRVLRGVNLTADYGDFIAIKGVSGSGKTTLLSIPGTLSIPDSGNYFLDGVNIFGGNIDLSSIRNKKIGFVFQDRRLMPQLTAFENILLPVLACKPRTDRKDNEYARKLMEMTGISSTAKQYPTALSGGEASRTALCRALIMKPKLLLADEPTGQLDAENSRNIGRLLSEINRTSGTIVIMATHSDEMSSFANKVYNLRDGILT